MAPPKATFPLDLQEWLDFNTPQRKNQEPKELSATPTCLTMQPPNRDKEVITPVKLFDPRCPRSEWQIELNPYHDTKAVATPPAATRATSQAPVGVGYAAAAQSEVSVVQRGPSRVSVPDEAKRYDDESSEQQTPAAKRPKKKADNDDASYNPEDGSQEGSDCNTDGIVKNSKKVRPRQGASVLKSASRRGASRQAKAKAKRQSKPPPKMRMVAQQLPFGHALPKREVRHLS